MDMIKVHNPSVPYFEFLLLNILGKKTKLILNFNNQCRIINKNLTLKLSMLSFQQKFDTKTISEPIYYKI
jgi:hypothetical protein